MEAVVSKSGGTSAVSIPQEYLSELGIAENDRVKISKRGSVITIEKVSECEKTDSSRKISGFADANPAGGVSRFRECEKTDSSRKISGGVSRFRECEKTDSSRKISGSDSRFRECEKTDSSRKISGGDSRFRECEKTEDANPKSLRNLIEERAGMDFEEYLKINPYSRETDNIESGTAGDEVI